MRSLSLLALLAVVLTTVQFERQLKDFEEERKKREKK